MFKRLFNGLILLAFMIGMFFGTARPVAAAAIIYVNDNAAGSNNGTSWANAYTNLKTAINAAASGDQVWVAAGTYKPTTNSDRTISFNLKTGVAIYGGFAGTESLLTERDPSVNVTILSGDIGTLNDTSDNSYHVVNGSSTINTAILDGFTITGGYSSGLNDDGGGIYILTGASPTLANLNVSNNHADNRGGGFFSFISSAPSLTNVAFSGNSAGQSGGGMYTQGASPTLTNVSFENNDANDMGGGMYNTDGSFATLTNVTFNGNSAVNSGGGMRNITSDPTLNNVTFTANSASFGGGMQNVGASPTLNNVTFSGNTSGGALYNSSSYPILRNSILYGNTGGEIINTNGSVPTVIYSIVQGGYAGTGNLSSNPLLGALGNNGGFTQTMNPRANSPAINKGNNASCTSTDQRGILRPQGPKCDIGAVEIEMLSLTLKSDGANDGWILESTETSGLGGTMNSAATTFNLGDNNARKQYRAILHFDTSSLPDNAVLTKVTLKIKKQGLAGTNPFTILGNLTVDMRKPSFGTLALALTDFNSAAGRTAVATFGTTPVANWYSAILNGPGRNYVNKTGTTQFRLRFATDDNNNAVADFMKFFSGNAGAAARPQLIVEYYVP